MPAARIRVGGDVPAGEAAVRVRPQRRLRAAAAAVAKRRTDHPVSPTCFFAAVGFAPGRTGRRKKAGAEAGGGGRGKRRRRRGRRRGRRRRRRRERLAVAE
eukprot:SAG31_NODE_4930_length_2856_cov_3.387378_2_plen_101_part_00